MMLLTLSRHYAKIRGSSDLCKYQLRSKRFEDGKVPMKVLLKDVLTAYKYGLKTLYYQNTRDGAEDAQEDLDEGCAGGACKI